MINFTMNDGRQIPALGFGVYLMTSAEVEEHLPQAIELGCRHIDTANAYFNEASVGIVVRSSGIPREEFFVTTKLFPQSYPYEQCKDDIDATLERLGMDNVDLLLFHQPYGEYVSGWKAMEEAVVAGKVRSIGLSNFPVRKIKQIMEVATIKPAALQVEVNPYWNQHALKAELAEIGLGDVILEGWYPFGHGDAKLLSEPVLGKIAEAHGKTTAQVILRWMLQEGVVTFPKTTNPQHMRDNFDVFDFELSDDEMAHVNALPQQAYYDVPEDAPDFVLVHNDYSKQA